MSFSETNNTGKGALIRATLLEAFPPTGQVPCEFTKTEVEVVCRVHNFQGPPAEYLLLYPKERIIAGYWLLLKLQGKYNPHGHRPATLGMTYNNEKRMKEQGLIESKNGRVFAKTNLWYAYSCTKYWFDHLAKKKEDKNWLENNWLSLYKFHPPVYITPENQKLYEKKPWGLLEAMAADLKIREEFLRPRPVAPRQIMDIVRRNNGIEDWRIIPERLLIPTQEERAWMIHLYSVYTAEEKRIIIPVRALPTNDFVQDNLTGQGLVHLRETNDGGAGIVLTKKGAEAYEVTYYHMLMTGQMSKF